MNPFVFPRGLPPFSLLVKGHTEEKQQEHHIFLASFSQRKPFFSSFLVEDPPTPPNTGHVSSWPRRTHVRPSNVRPSAFRRSASSRPASALRRFRGVGGAVAGGPGCAERQAGEPGLGAGANPTRTRREPSVPKRRVAPLFTRSCFLVGRVPNRISKNRREQKGWHLEDLVEASTGVGGASSWK